MYTSVEVQCSVFIEDWQAIAPNGLLAAIAFHDVEWANFASIVAMP